MTWNGTKTWAVGDGPWSASLMNQYVRDNIQYVRDTQRIASFSGLLPSAINSAPTNYNDITGLKVVFFKKNASTYLACRIDCQCWVTTAPTSIRLGIYITGSTALATDADGAPFLFNQANVLKHIYGGRIWLGQQPVGRYVFQGRFKVTAGTGAFNINTACYAQMEVVEDAIE